MTRCAGKYDLASAREELSLRIKHQWRVRGDVDESVAEISSKTSTTTRLSAFVMRPFESSVIRFEVVVSLLAAGSTCRSSSPETVPLAAGLVRVTRTKLNVPSRMPNT